MRSTITKSPPQQSYSVNKLATMLNADRRTIHKAVFGVEPVKVDGKTKYYALDAVQDALKAKPDRSKKEELLDEQIRKLRILNNKLDKSLTPKAKIIDFFNAFVGEHRGTLHQILENEYPTAVAGMDPPQARILGKRLADKLDEIAQRYGAKLATIE